MAQWIKYNILQNTINIGTEAEPVYENIFVEKKLPYSEENLVIAQDEAYNGEYTIEDGDAVEVKTVAEMIQDLEDRINNLPVIMSGKEEPTDDMGKDGDLYIMYVE